ncbi:MAG: AraC family transcriptional regulator [Bryobacter sp.]|nr:AraC family transcriptional regulator [Bryobacter sp.]
MGICKCDNFLVRYFQRRPASPLHLFVESLWVYRSEPAIRRIERVLPSGAPQLVVNLAEDQTRIYRAQGNELLCAIGPGSILSGVSSSAQLIDSDELTNVAGVTFRPGGTLPFVAQPASDFTNRDVPLDSVWGSETTNRLRDRLLSAHTASAVLDILEQTLFDTWNDRALHPVVGFALGEFLASASVAQVAKVKSVIGLSEKRFIERFKSEVGVTPKRFCRLKRFQQVVSSAHQRNEVEWADLALSCGYTDQAHLIHEFREFSGITPRAYGQGKTSFQNHVSFLQS